MSVDTYFCFCCLSTNELSSIFTYDSRNSCADLLKDLFGVKISPDDHADDGYVCEVCEKKIKEAYDFKSQILTTLKMLENYGLIKIDKTEKEMCVMKYNNNFADKEDKYDFETKWLDTSHCDLKSKLDDAIKQEVIEANKIENTQIFAEAKTIPDATTSNPKLVVERDKNPDKGIKGKKRREVKREQSYKVTSDFKCEVCAVKLPNIYVYHTHMNEHYPNHICEACGKGFLTERRLKRHMPSHKRGPFKCQSCDAEFTNYNTLCSHRQRKHSSVQLYKCPHCEERFSTFTRRALHLAAAHQQPTGMYSCRLCKKRFLLSGNLSAHMRNKHLKIKRHFCSECGAGFFHKQELTGHMAAHTGVNQYHCDICNKRYPRKKALDVHRRLHNNDKRFLCTTCGKRFLQKCTLQAHLKTHANKHDEI